MQRRLVEVGPDGLRLALLAHRERDGEGEGVAARRGLLGRLRGVPRAAAHDHRRGGHLWSKRVRGRDLGPKGLGIGTWGQKG